MHTQAKKDFASHLPDLPVSRSGASGINRKVIANLGEDVAASFLQDSGYRLLERNWRSGRFGEIDIIAVSAMGLLVFAEVKTRRWSSDTAGFCEAGFNAINWKKRQKILTTARSYLSRKGYVDAPARLDAILVQFRSASYTGETPRLSGIDVLHVPGAFDSI